MGGGRAYAWRTEEWVGCPPLSALFPETRSLTEPGDTQKAPVIPRLSSPGYCSYRLVNPILEGCWAFEPVPLPNRAISQALNLPK